MHEGCVGNFQSGKQVQVGKQVVDKLRSMGFSVQYSLKFLNLSALIAAMNLSIKHFKSKCPKCNMVYGVTPCHPFDPENIMPAGVNY